MDSRIAFVGSMDDRSRDQWVAELHRAMPEERIVPLALMSNEERTRADVAIVTNPTAAELGALPNLVWIQSLWAGVEKLVLTHRDVRIPIVRLVDHELSRRMGEAVLAWTYYLHRDMPAYALQQRKAAWRQRPYRPPSSVQVGILGLGEMGRAAADRLIGAGFRVAAWSRTAKTTEFETFSGDEGLAALLACSDIIVCLLPLTPDTRSLLDAGRFRQMKAGASLINFGRGAIVEADDLVAALDGNHLDHAVLDVFEHEPLAPDSGLWRHPKVTVLPHISAPTGIETAASAAAANIREFRRSGRIPPGVDRILGY